MSSSAAAWRLAAAAALACLVASGGAAASAEPADSLFQKQGLGTWLEGLQIPLPDTGSFNLGVGRATLRGGNCTGLTVQRLGSVDSSSGLVLEFDVMLVGLGIQCHLDMFSGGAINLNLTLRDSALNATLQIHPFYPAFAAEMPMPFGHLNTTNCAADVQIDAAAFAMSGSSPLVAMASQFPKELVVGQMEAMFGPMLCQSLTTLIEEKGTDEMRKSAELAQFLLLPPREVAAPEVLRPALDWGTYPPVVVLKNMIAERFSLWSNRAVEFLNVASFNANLVRTENVSLDLRQLKVEGIGGKHSPGFSLVGENQTLGFITDLPGLVVDAVAVLTVDLPGQPTLTEVVALKGTLKSASMTVRAVADEEGLDSIKLREILREPQCLVTATEGMTSPPRDSFAVTDMHIDMTPLFEILAYGSVEEDVTTLANSLVRSVFEGYMPTMNTLVNGALGLARAPIDKLVWSVLDQPGTCANADAAEFGFSQAAIDALPWVSLAFLAVGAVVAALAHTSRLPCVTSAEAPTGNDARTVAAGSCLACDPAVPRALGYFFPFAVLAVLFLFFYADFALGATVSVAMEAHGETTMVGPVVTFSLLSTIVHSMTSGSWVISVLTLIMSGLWPLVKLGMLVVTWVMPPQSFSRRARRRVLSFLDAWGKYGLVESWFLVFCISAFAIQWSSVGEDASLRVVTAPETGFYAFFFATLLSLLLGHIASETDAYATRRRMKAAEGEIAVMAPTAVAPPAGEPASSPAQVQAATPRSSSTSQRANSVDDASEESSVSGSSSNEECASDKRQALCTTVSRFGRVAVACALAASLALTICGCWMTSFDFSIHGIFIEFLVGFPVEHVYSLVSLGASVTRAQDAGSGMKFLEAMFFILSIALPMLLLVALAVLWVVPMTPRGQKSLLHACHILDAWACLDVAVLVMVLAILQFGSMAEYLISKGSLSTPCRFIKDLADESCLDISMHPHAGLVPLVLAGVALLIVPKVSMRAAAAALRHRKVQAKCVEEAPMDEQAKADAA